MGKIMGGFASHSLQDSADFYKLSGEKNTKQVEITKGFLICSLNFL